MEGPGGAGRLGPEIRLRLSLPGPRGITLHLGTSASHTPQGPSRAPGQARLQRSGEGGSLEEGGRMCPRFSVPWALEATPGHLGGQTTHGWRRLRGCLPPLPHSAPSPFLPLGVWEEQKEDSSCPREPCLMEAPPPAKGAPRGGASWC